MNRNSSVPLLTTHKTEFIGLLIRYLQKTKPKFKSKKSRTSSVSPLQHLSCRKSIQATFLSPSSLLFKNSTCEQKRATTSIFFILNVYICIHLFMSVCKCVYITKIHQWEYALSPVLLRPSLCGVLR